MRRLLTGLLGASLLLGACGGNDDDDRSLVTSIPEQTTTSTTTTTPPVPPPDVIPDDPALITEEYVEQVLNLLFEVSFDAAEIARHAGIVDSDAIARLEATSTQTSAAQRIDDLVELTVLDFDGIRDDPSPIRLQVVTVLEVTPECVFAEVLTDSSGFLIDAYSPEGTRDFVRLHPADEGQQSSGLNPTAWALDEFPVTLDGTVPDARCEQ
jgi:hypothetical protein